jgi:hypothetical protein
VARALGKLNDAIRSEHKAAIAKLNDLQKQSIAFGGGISILQRYLGWLDEGGQSEWANNATTRIFDLASPAFRQFRREEANRHPYGYDPITGLAPYQNRYRGLPNQEPTLPNQESYPYQNRYRS